MAALGPSSALPTGEKQAAGDHTYAACCKKAGIAPEAHGEHRPVIQRLHAIAPRAGATLSLGAICRSVSGSQVQEMHHELC